MKYDDLKRLAIHILDDLYCLIIETNQLKVDEYSKDVKRFGDPAGWFRANIKIHSERVRYAKWLRKNCAFYERVIATLAREIKPNG